MTEDFQADKQLTFLEKLLIISQIEKLVTIKIKTTESGSSKCTIKTLNIAKNLKLFEFVIENISIFRAFEKIFSEYSNLTVI